MFYQYEEGHGCKEYFFWHLFMMNNIWPWGEKDYCLHQSWYLANDIWFLVPCIFQAGTYYRNRKWFYRTLCFQTGLALAA
jgi:hypothetical protein